MSKQLADGQYDLDGLLFGGPDDAVTVQADGDAAGAWETRHQDRPSPIDDFLFFGRDQFTPPARSLVLIAHADDNGDARPAAAAFKAAWRARSWDRPGAWSVLRWRVGGITYRSYGRPRAAQTVGQPVNDPSYVELHAEWQSRDGITYRDDPDSLDLTLLVPDSRSAIILPAVLPWRLGPGPARRTGVIDLNGTAAVPFGITVQGPTVGAASHLVLSGPGWRLDFGAMPLPAGQVLTINTAARTAMIGSASVAGVLRRGSSLRALLQPGPQEITLEADDPSNTTRASFTWRRGDY